MTNNMTAFYTFALSFALCAVFVTPIIFMVAERHQSKHTIAEIVNTAGDTAIILRSSIGTTVVEKRNIPLYHGLAVGDVVVLGRNGDNYDTGVVKQIIRRVK